MNKGPEFSQTENIPASDNDDTIFERHNKNSNESDIKYPERFKRISFQRRGKKAFTIKFKDRKYNKLFDPKYYSEAQLNLRVAPFMLGFTKKDATAITNAFEHGIEDYGQIQGITHGANVEIRRLSRVLHLKEMPSFEYLPDELGDCLGKYNSKENKIYLYSQHDAISTIAHEMWHAYQYDVKNNSILNTKRKKQYQLALSNYKGLNSSGAKVNAAQLVEREAEAFAVQVTKYIEKNTHAIDFGPPPTSDEPITQCNRSKVILQSNLLY